jgi:hypothetical protein
MVNASFKVTVGVVCVLLTVKLYKATPLDVMVCVLDVPFTVMVLLLCVSVVPLAKLILPATLNVLFSRMPPPELTVRLPKIAKAGELTVFSSAPPVKLTVIFLILPLEGVCSNRPEVSIAFEPVYIIFTPVVVPNMGATVNLPFWVLEMVAPSESVSTPALVVTLLVTTPFVKVNVPEIVLSKGIVSPPELFTVIFAGPLVNGHSIAVAVWAVEPAYSRIAFVPYVSVEPDSVIGVAVVAPCIDNVPLTVVFADKFLEKLLDNPDNVRLLYKPIVAPVPLVATPDGLTSVCVAVESEYTTVPESVIDVASIEGAAPVNSRVPPLSTVSELITDVFERVNTCVPAVLPVAEEINLAPLLTVKSPWDVLAVVPIPKPTLLLADKVPDATIIFLALN